MKATKITNGNTHVIVGGRDLVASLGEVRSVSSTEAQPYTAHNYRDGLKIGGRTMTQGEVDLLISKAKAAAMVVEAIEI